MLKIAHWVWLTCFERTVVALCVAEGGPLNRRNDSWRASQEAEGRMCAFSRTGKPFSFGSKLLSKGRERQGWNFGELWGCAVCQCCVMCSAHDLYFTVLDSAVICAHKELRCTVVEMERGELESFAQGSVATTGPHNQRRGVEWQESSESYFQSDFIKDGLTPKF